VVHHGRSLIALFVITGLIFITGCTQQASATVDSGDRQLIEADIWKMESAIFEGRGRGDLSNYLDVTSSQYLGWPPVLDKPLSLEKFRSEENMGQSTALRGEVITFEKNGFTMNENTAITYFTSHRTRMGEGMAVNGSRDVDEYYENTHIWTFEDGKWRLIGGMARKLDAPRAIPAAPTMRKYPDRRDAAAATTIAPGWGTMKRRWIAASALIALAGCNTAPAGSAIFSTQDNGTTAKHSPTTLAELQDATILDVDRYRPTYKLTACKPRELPEGVAEGAFAEALARAEAYSNELDGVGMIVLRDGAIVHEDYIDGANGTTLTASASMMKSVLGLLVGIALDNGMAGSVDDPVGSYLDEWSGDPRGEITIRQLLTMSTGLGQSDFTTLLLAPDIGKIALETPLIEKPGSSFAYNNAASQLLGMVIDRQAAKAGYHGFADFLHRELWCPLGNGEALLWIDASGKPRGYAGLHAGLRDWARIGELIRNGGKIGSRQIVPSTWIANMARPSEANTQYGFQLWLGRGWTPLRRYSATNPIMIPHAEPFVSQDIVYFDGFGGQRVYVVPSRGLTIARVGMVNLSYDDSIIPNILIRAIDQTPGKMKP